MMTRTHALAIALVGVWIGWTLFMWFLAGRSFATVDSVLKSENPQFTSATQSMTREQSRMVLRHLASEINRTAFRAYGWGQIVLGTGLLLLVLRQAPRDNVALALAIGMLAIVLVLTLIVTPQIISIGRSIDFLPRNPPPPGFHRFWMLHGAFTLLDGAKLVTGLVLLARWVWKG